MTDQNMDVIVTEARRDVHEALVLLPAWEADRVRSLIADLETAIEGRAAMRADTPKPSVTDQEDIHAYFGLSYANYLVLPRTLLQSMPDSWQHQFVALLNQLHDAFEHVPQAETYQVTAGKTMQLDDMTASQLATAGISVEGDDTDGPGAETRYHRESDGAELSGQDYAFLPGRDPVPHYNRGRARVQPQLHSCGNCEGLDPASCLMNDGRRA